MSPSLLTLAALLLLLPGDRSHHHEADLTETPDKSLGTMLLCFRL
jgi:hypothetical protein